MPVKLLLYLVSYNILYIIIQSIVTYMNHHNSPSPGGRELEGVGKRYNFRQGK